MSDKENVVYIDNRILFSHKNVGNSDISNNMDKREASLLSEISYREKNAIWSYMWILKVSKLRKNLWLTREWGKWGDVYQGYKLSVVRWITLEFKVQHGYYSWKHCIVYLKGTMRIDLKCSHLNNNKNKNMIIRCY